MRALRWLALLTAVAVLSGCGSSAAPSQGRGIAFLPGNVQLATPASTVRNGEPASSGRKSPAGCDVAQAAPVLPAARPSIRNLAIVGLSGSNGFVVRDITDFANPRTVFVYPQLSSPRFISSFELASVSYVDENKLVRAAIDATSSSIVATGCVGMIAFAWSPNAAAAAYVTDLDDRSGSQLHIVSGGMNRVVSLMPSVPWGVDCEAPECTDRLDSRLLYSPDGAYISFVQSWGGPSLRIWSSYGQLLRSSDSSGIAAQGVPTMSVWSGDTLYYRDGGGVESWHAGSGATPLPHVQWIRPKASPAGGSIVYETRDADGIPRIFLLDVASGVVRQIAAERSEPSFLTSRFIWWQGERPCATSDPWPCGSGGKSITTGKTYIYDLQAGTESESAITTVWDVWPHPA